MIEVMLEAERAMGIGLIDNAERLYAQVVAVDPRNSIAVTGLARVALERGDQRTAYAYARRALAIDPDNPVAGHLAMRMAEQMRNRGEILPDDLPADPTGPVAPSAEVPSPGAARPSTGPSQPSTGPSQPSTGLVDRFLRRRR